MSASKRRKLDTAPEKPTLSAFAARRALKSEPPPPRRPNGKPTNEESILDSSSVSMLKKQPSEGFEASSIIQQESEDGSGLVDDESASDVLLSLEGEQLLPFLSQSDVPDLPIQRPSVAFSTFSPSTHNFKELSNGTVSLKIAPGERLVVLGQFGLSIQKGHVTLLGAMLHASKKVHRFFASSSHSLPVLRCPATDIDHAELRLQPCESGLSFLKDLSPLFGRLWNDHSGLLGPDYGHLVKNSGRSTFQILFSDNGAQGAYLQPLISPPEWNSVLSTCSTITTKPRMILICGPKSSGKSTFAKLLVNKLLTTQGETTNQKKTGKINGVALLDLDPGQPEYSAPGQLSLIHVQKPNFGPPFSHPTTSSANKSIRSHSIGAISPAMDPSLYMECALDLFAHYRNLLSSSPTCPLVVNTPGWVLGTGLEILVELIQKIIPSEVIYMSQEGPSEVAVGLREADKSVPLLTLPSQLSEYTTRTAAHLRTMQYMSYFHLEVTNKEGLAWGGKPLTSIAPWEIRYSGESPGVIGILCYGEQPPKSLLAETINGSLVSVVVIDDLSAIPGWSSSNTADVIWPENQDTGDIEHQAFNDEDIHLGRIEKPLVIRTSDEDLPYFNPANSICLDPKNSHSIGLALIRGIDTNRKRLQVLTPIDPSVIQGIQEAGKSIVLISGKLDTPGWAYTEDLLLRTAVEKRRNEGEEDDDVDELKEDGQDTLLEESFQNAPWIERLEGSQGRGIGSRVWRVRRDLGKVDD